MGFGLTSSYLKGGVKMRKGSCRVENTGYIVAKIPIVLLGLEKK
jgi:hypothetical protein